jgi:hypothetical protein
MRVIFVGIHNKPNKQPLDSSTMTGRVIDRIIEKIPAICIKTNLCDIDYFPKEKKLIWPCNLEWNERQQPTSDTIIVLLGGWVQKNFLLTEAKIIKLAHPASFNYRSKEQTEEYINSSVKKIKAKLT